MSIDQIFKHNMAETMQHLTIIPICAHSKTAGSNGVAHTHSLWLLYQTPFIWKGFYIIVCADHKHISETVQL